MFNHYAVMFRHVSLVARVSPNVRNFLLLVPILEHAVVGIIVRYPGFMILSLRHPILH